MDARVAANHHMVANMHMARHAGIIRKNIMVADYAVMRNMRIHHQ